jgi:hypothetical protein
MKILKYIWNLFFGSKKKDSYSKGGMISEIEKEVSSPYSNPSTDEILVKDSVVLNEEKLVQELVLGREKESVSVSENKPKNKRRKNVVGQKTLNEIKEYLITYGSLDVFTCEQKFKVKSLHNFIWFLRKEGFEIKTDKVVLHNELGQKIEVTNYRLINKK